MDLIDQLRDVVGDRVSAAPSERVCYSSDASQIKGMPDYVVRPISTEEVSKVVTLAAELGVPVTARGAGTGLAGGAVPVKGGIVLDMSGMNRILELDLENLQVIVEPGVVQARLNEVLKPHGFFFPPDPGSSNICTIGGLIANNGSGMRCVKYGTTKSYVLDLEVVLADGRVVRTGSRMLKSAAGYDLTRLFIGSEGTLGIITKAGLRVAPLPKARRLVIASFDDAETAGRAVAKTFASGIVPSACEILDRTTIAVLLRCDSNLVLPEGDVILFEVDGTESSTKESAEEIVQVCSPFATNVVSVSGEKEMEEIWEARRLVGAAVSRIDPKKSRIYVGEDVGVPIKKIPVLIREIGEISERFDLPAMKYGHIGDGNLHVALFIDVLNEDEWARLEAAADAIHRAAIRLGGTVSSEHGVGAARAGYMKMQWGEGTLSVMRAIKRVLDPQGIINPGKLGLDDGPSSGGEG
ncbi:MAG TPA: FAD-linked oxidase C-terminal domain-containing protein [Methanothrix sp.]|nr:FAD-linked oxidase C-terminal domain-containing protein [Methanothrix sp.]HPJ84206.1 FAD-linked oxidase C-terminal domain-containing protein [Methanothrix sp.]HPR66102.1 FAD-linked oxidase C-terminal domain-containing protein [Methanothrix sp.]